jgi:UDP-N-acetylmuramate--alanine ligase
MTRHLHFMGAGGVGMCGLAEVMLAEGSVVSGCDLMLSERTERLVELGVDIHEGHSPDHLGGVDTLVISSAVSRDHEEVRAARERGLPVVLRAELLGELMRGRRGVAVAGTHGKTTTTALLGHLVIAAGLDPTVLVGGQARSLGAHARHGAGNLMVCEADEYDRSFLELEPEIAVVTNLEAEHLDCYRDDEDLRQSFASFANKTSNSGVVVLSADDAGARQLRPLLLRRVLSFGESEEAEIRAIDPTLGPDGCRFGVRRGGSLLGELNVPLIGRHNVANALAAVAVGLELELPFELLAEACASFEGVGRRFELLGERDGVTVVDDYAHHPTELAVVLDAARNAMPDRRLVVIFQPHLYSRTQHFADGFAEALMKADVAVVLPIYPAREKPIEGVSAQLVVDGARRLGHPDVGTGPPVDESNGLLDDLVRSGDVLITMGAGDVHTVAEKWLERGE